MRSFGVCSLGRLASQALWASGDSAFAPRELKWAVGEVREEFLGFAQQDSQELLAFLLDGLHEDLNRVRKKPYYEVSAILSCPADSAQNCGCTSFAY